jgi:molecular chaperone DnaK (HSP70)
MTRPFVKRPCGFRLSFALLDAQKMRNNNAFIFTLVAFFCSCTVNQNNDAILEANSPAIGKTGTLAEYLGLETLGGVFDPVLKQGCALPCKSSFSISTVQDNQDQITITLFRGKDTLVSNNHRLGACRIEVPPAPRATPQIEVTIETVQEEIRISALDKVSAKSLPIQCTDKPVK